MPGKIFNIVLLTAFASAVYSQTGGDNVYEFLNLTPSGLVSSLGGATVSLPAENLNTAYHNPALLDKESAGCLALNYSNYLAGINYGMAIYSFSLQGTGNLAAGITYLNYGSFIESNASGVVTGTFTAAEYALNVIYSWQPDSMFSFGINFKPVLSHLEKYTSLGVAFDIGAAWHSRNKLISAGLAIRNAGFQITRYAGEPGQKLPFEILAGATAKLAHAPLRFSLTARHLEKFDLTWDYETDTSGDSHRTSGSFSDNLFRHFIAGVELIPHRNFYFSAGYNHQRRKELTTTYNSSSAGLSWGFGINTTILDLEYGRAVYHPAISSDNISLIVRPHLLYKKLSKLN